MQGVIETDLTLHEVETRHIAAVLEHHRCYKPAAAKALGISLKTLYNKINTEPSIQTLVKNWRAS